MDLSPYLYVRTNVTEHGSKRNENEIFERNSEFDHEKRQPKKTWVGQVTEFAVEFKKFCAGEVMEI